MLKQEIIDKITSYFKLTQFEAEKVYNEIFSFVIQGVKSDNIVDVVNFGEFIIKYNNGNGNSEFKKTVEFLAAPDLDDDINLRFSGRTVYTSAVNKTEEIIAPMPVIQNSVPPIQETLQSVTDTSIDSSIDNPIQSSFERTNETVSDSSISIEDDLKKKRESILNKLTVEAPLKSISEIKSSTYDFKKSLEDKISSYAPKAEDTTSKITEVITPQAVIAETKDNINDTVDTSINRTTETIQEAPKPVESSIDDISTKSFSDYFDEKKTEEKPLVENIVQPTVPLFTNPVPLNPLITNPIPPTMQVTNITNVIPQQAVDLHNELTNKTDYADQKPVVSNETSAEFRNPDNSYYIWYKDSEANPADTQTMTYEYELLYQATKEAEYKSKLRVYVTTFIVFFSLVLALLIFSPLIYKVFFKPADVQMIEETQTQPNSQPGKEAQKDQLLPLNNNNNNNQPQNNVTQPEQNNTQQTTEQKMTTTPSSDLKAEEKPQQDNVQTPVQKTQNTEAPKTTEQTKNESPKTETKKEQAPPPPVQNNSNLAGVTKNGLGWSDDKLKVIYIQLENGKFTIQESAWDSDTKASKRIGTIEGYRITGLIGNVVKVDLGARGIWFRTRLGEFSSLVEAKKKAEELRSKEGMRLQAMLLTFLLYA